MVLRLLVQVPTEVRPHRKLDQHHLEQVLVPLRRVLEARDRLHHVIRNSPERVAHRIQLLHRETGTRQRHLQNQNHVVDHEFVTRNHTLTESKRSVIHELRERLCSLSSHKHPLIGQLSQRTLANSTRHNGTRLDMKTPPETQTSSLRKLP